MKKRLLISFSGGKTSAYMLWWLMNEWEDRHNWEIIVVFANTGKEAEGTLYFVDECSQEWNIPIWWVEGYPSEEGKGWKVVHKVVDFETASRNGEPFEAMISRLGIPSSNAPFCSYQLKKHAIESFLESIGWVDYYTAIGIRVDEPNRLPENEKIGLDNKKMYPLAYMNPKMKRDVSMWWHEQTFNLNIHPDDGNCDNCWKKDMKRLVRNAQRNPKSLDWWQSMTDKYGYFNPRETDLLPPFNFYRGNLSPVDILAMAKDADRQLDLFKITEPISTCNESCEAF